MKCISVKQPWATKIANGCKTIETRTWSTNYRGPLAIASSKKPCICPKRIYPAGCVVCVVKLIDCRPMTAYDEAAACCDLYDGAWAWILEDIKKIEPRKVKGQLSIYDIDLENLPLLGK